MNDSRPGPIRRIFGFIWDAVNFSRRLVFNLLFLLIVVVIIAAVVGGGGVRLEEKTALVIAPEGAIVEQYTTDPVSRALSKSLGDEVKEVQLRDLLRAIEGAKTDPNIQRIFLRTDKITGAGIAQLREIGQALREFRKAGKQVVAYADYMDQKGYALAAQADEIYLHPQGMVLLEGLGRYRQYYREGLQDKLGVDVHLFKVGEYKSAAEPFVLDAASPEAKEADLFWMGDIWRRYLGDIASARRLDAGRLQAQIDNLPETIKAANGDLALLARRQKLVDELKTLDEVRKIMIKRGVEDEENHTFRQISLPAYVAHLDRRVNPLAKTAKVAVVVAQGEITGGEQPPGVVGGESTARLLRTAREDEDVKAVVLRVDSPGGEVFASEQIRREVELNQAAGKPVVVSMGNVAASGGYWIAMDADRIYADPSTITGSIGIFGLWLAVPDTLAKIGVRTDGVGTTQLAGAFDITRPFDPRVGEVLQSVIEKGYRDFTGKVAKARERSQTQIDTVGRGRVWSGAQAKQRGLVDELGGLRQAQAKAAELAKLKPDEFRVVYVEKPLTPFEQFFAGFGRSARLSALLRASGVGQWLLSHEVAAPIAKDFAWLERNARAQPFRALAHCFCGL